LLTLRGRTYTQKGNLDLALQSFQQQLQLAEQANDQSQIALLHTQIGNLLIEMERFQDALGHYDESYARNNSLGNQLNKGYDLMNRGTALWWLGKDGAASALGQARDIADRPDNSYKELLASVYLMEAQMFFSEQRLDEARAKCQQALDLAGKQYKYTAARAKIMLGLMQASSGQASAGRQLCEAALSEAKQTGDPRLIARVWLALAETALAEGNAQDALANAEQAQSSFSQRGQAEPEWRACLIAGEASRKMGDREKADRYFSRAAELLSALQQKWGEEVFNNYLARHDIQLYHKRLTNPAK
jgi:tetratricopeptide (TPR) repeat protein